MAVLILSNVSLIYKLMSTCRTTAIVVQLSFDLEFQSHSANSSKVIFTSCISFRDLLFWVKPFNDRNTPQLKAQGE